MDDSELEITLRKYRPSGPRAGLRDRIFAAEPRRIWPWAGAAAALLISTLMLNVASRQEVAEAGEGLGPDASARVVDRLTDMLGGDAPARELAELIVFEQRVRTETTVAAEAQVLVYRGERQ